MVEQSELNLKNLVTNTCYFMNLSDIVIFFSLILYYDLLVYFVKDKKSSLLSYTVTQTLLFSRNTLR